MATDPQEAPTDESGVLVNRAPTQVSRPATGEPRPTADPTTFLVRHPSDGPFYDAIKAFNAKHGIHALPFPPPRGSANGGEPVLTLHDVLGGSASTGAGTGITWITNNKQIVFHALGDCGSTRGPSTQNLVVDKMVADFNEASNTEVPQFHVLLGDIVYSFGEVKYYYDQFYDPYRDYPAPILAAAGNHDGLPAPDSGSQSLEGFLRNFCADQFAVMPEAGGLARTAQIQPGVFFTFEAPFVTIIFLYSNALEDPGVIADNDIGNSQLLFLRAALTRLKKANYNGALLFAHHHPAYTLSRHGWSIDMQAQIDKICDEVGLWPHADLAGHAHNYQRFTRRRSDGTQVPYVVCGNGGHNVQKLSPVNGDVLRAPQVIQEATPGGTSSPLQDQVVFENYDDQNYGYLRIIADAQQLRIEYHPASDGTSSKTPDDFVTVSLADRQLVHFDAPVLGRPKQAKQVANTAAKALSAGPAAPQKRLEPHRKRSRKKTHGRRPTSHAAPVGRRKHSKAKRKKSRGYRRR
ncbi:MAG: metallophosphoesterase [Candidatus Cybelea sp.]